MRSKTKPATRSKINTKKDSILVVINQTGNSKTQFRYFDHFGISQLSVFPGNDTLSIKGYKGITAYNTSAADFSDLTYYTLYPNDTVYLNVEKGKEILTSKNKELQEKIKLMSQLFFHVGSINYSKKDDFIAGTKAINDFYRDKKHILEDHKSKIDNRTYKEVNDIINYDKLAGMLALCTQHGKENDSVLIVLNKADSNSWNYLTFRNVLDNYPLYVNKIHHINTANQVINYINASLPASIHDFALFNYLKDYNPDTKSKLDTLTQLIVAFNKTATPKDFAHYLMKNLEKYKFNIEAKVSKEVQLERQSSSEIISFEQVLKQFKGKIIYLDFWASWCAPCLAEMPASHALAMKLEKGKSDIVFLYISKDENMSAWERKASDIRLPATNSFIILKNKAFIAFSDTFHLNMIPRYMIIGKNGKMINQDAPRPGDKDLYMLFNKLSKQ